MKIIYASLVCCVLGLSDPDAARGAACSQLHAAFANESLATHINGYHGIQSVVAGQNCENMLIPHSESVSGGYCLASLTAAGYYRAGTVNPVIDLMTELSGNHGGAPVVTGSNSGGTMFIIRYFAYRDFPLKNKWTFPCYLLNSGYRSVCFFHGDFGLISSECYAETQNVVGAATGIIYGPMMMQYGGPLGIVASYCSVYFGFLSNLPISTEDTGFGRFWATHSHWNIRLSVSSNWVAAYSLVSSLEASSGLEKYNFGWDSFLSRGLNARSNSEWYSNMSVFTAASISANTLSAISMIPFSFAGKQWDNSADITGLSTSLKVFGLLMSYVMLQKLVLQHTVLSTRLPPLCESGCPVVDGGYTDNGPVTPVLAASSDLAPHLQPRQLALLGPANTMASISYLLGTGPLALSAGAGINLCPFTQISICNMITDMRKMVVPLLSYDDGQSYQAIHSHYEVFRPNQQAIKPFCADPLIFDHFQSMCEGNSICHMAASAVPGVLTAIGFSISQNVFILNMLWLAPTKIASRFVHQYIPSKMLNMRYYANMDLWFPDFVATAPQKGGTGFTKVAGHSLLDYLTYLVQRLVAAQIKMRTDAFELSLGHLPPCGYHVFAESQNFNTVAEDQTRE